MTAKKGVARFPVNSQLGSMFGPKDRVVLTVDGRREKVSLKAEPRGFGEGDEVFVTPDTFDLPDRQQINGFAEKTTAFAARMRWLFQTTAGVITLVGLVLALIAAGINIALQVGEIAPVFVVGSDGVGVLKAVVLVLGIGGVVTVFLTSLLSK
ncbi:hypothetical protein [Microbacterium rhizosphaerae]|uniref:Uncharacterized protein n=1 Tax=Microbacterium rhizosphaerae TaxID=1678237 RepID=A0ABZ0SSA7_9MICO|nr:hypothetical protein [Microbacterium rhizosphaerae]WPR91320.1 hypothetical protein SM116_08605 [Microbacterium rhizosphaerae]